MGSDRFQTSNQAAAYLGISRPALYHLMERREITFYKVLTHARFTKEDLDSYLARIRVPSKHDRKPPKRPKRARSKR